MSKLFENKVVLITGGSSGIGKATALAFAKEGARLVIAARRETEGEMTVSEIKQIGGEAFFVKTDVSITTDVEKLVSKCIDVYGQLDCAVNNAGVEGKGFVPAAEYSEDEWDTVMNINLKGMWLCMKYQIPHLLKTKGTIVNMSSVAGVRGGPVGVAYHASKHGALGLTKSAALEYADKGIRINAVCPAVIVTDMADRLFFQDDSVNNMVKNMHPMGRYGTSEEVAKTVLWLSSDQSSYLTGHSLPVDGGFLAK